MSPSDNRQSSRQGKLHTALPFDALSLVRFDGMDAVNECFEYHVEALANESYKSINLDDLLGTHMTVELTTISGTPRYFDGIVTECGWAGEGDTGLAYRFTLRPWFWIMTKRFNNKIFQNMTFRDIFTQVCSDFGKDASAGHDIKAMGSGDVLEYTVQYGESDFTFLTRLLERHGVNFHFTHKLGEHKIVLTDRSQDFTRIDPLAYERHEGQHLGDKEHFWDWTPHRRLTTGAVTLMDYNFKSPAANMKGEQQATSHYSYGDLESYEYPGHYLEARAGTQIAQLRTDQFMARDKHHIATGDCLSLSSGLQFDLTGEHEDRQITGHPYVCTRAMHSFATGGYRSGGTGAAGEHSFVGNYEMVPASVPYAPERKTPETRMPGPQTATVVGVRGEEIDTDEYGRIVVQFHWDRDGRNDEGSSMRVRVAQPWAGKGWGTLFIPRIGMEVIVEFLEGDPNKPLVTGSVYNAANMPPYSQPEEKNWNGIKSSSTIGGQGYNEIVFNDTAGDELFRQHAQYDMETRVLNCERRNVDVDRTTEIGQDDVRKVGGDEKHTIEGNNTYLIKVDEKRTVEGERKTTIHKDDTLEVRGQMKTTVFNKTTHTGYKDIEITSLSKITLSVAGSSIVIDPSGIKLAGPTIDVNASAMLTTNGGAMAEHKSGGMMTIKAALVMIN